MKKSVKILCAVLALVLAVGAGIGGTLAYLTAKTGEVQNTFTYGDLALDLKETDTDGDHNDMKNAYTFVPGVNLTKDPKVTLSTPEGAKPVDSYVFIQENKVNWPVNSKISYAIDTTVWTSLESVPGVWYAKVAAEDVVNFVNKPIIKDNTITVSPELTKTEVDNLMAAYEGNGKNAQLNYIAYAIQQQGFDGPAAAWAKVSAK